MKAVRTWVLIADGARARILENTGPGHGLSPVQGMVFHGDHAATHDLVSDREGRGHSSHGPGRSAVESRDPHRELKTNFAHHLAGVLERALEQKSFDRLIIAAAPVTLGDLRTRCRIMFVRKSPAKSRTIWRRVPMATLPIISSPCSPSERRLPDLAY
jgi:protein required for attachment to host cells